MTFVPFPVWAVSRRPTVGGYAVIQGAPSTLLIVRHSATELQAVRSPSSRTGYVGNSRLTCPEEAVRHWEGDSLVRSGAVFSTGRFSLTPPGHVGNGTIQASPVATTPRLPCYTPEQNGWIGAGAPPSGFLASSQRPESSAQPAAGAIYRKVQRLRTGTSVQVRGDLHYRHRERGRTHAQRIQSVQAKLTIRQDKMNVSAGQEPAQVGRVGLEPTADGL
jgi:hypothetical protein